MGQEAAARLAAARDALVRAEVATGVRSSSSLAIQRAFSRAQGAEGSGLWDSLERETAGVVSLHGSVALLLAAAARRQGSEGWCAVLGSEDIGWCAAAELGLDLERTLLVPASELDPRTLLAAASALLDGVDVVLVSARASALLRSRDRRSLLARARERGVLLLTPFPWEGADVLEVREREVEDGLPTHGKRGAGVVEPVGDCGAGDVAEVLSLPHQEAPAATPAPMPAGRLCSLTWWLGEPGRPGGHRLVHDASGVRGQASGPSPLRPVPLGDGDG